MDENHTLTYNVVSVLSSLQFHFKRLLELSLVYLKKNPIIVIVNKPGIIFGIFFSPIKTYQSMKMAFEASSLKESINIILSHVDSCDKNGAEKREH